MRRLDLTNKIALVTGGGQGLGAAACKALIEAGARVIINYFDDAAGFNKRRAEETAQTLCSFAVPMKADVRNIEETNEMLESIMQIYGKIDIIINNAGILRDKTLKKISADVWQQVIDTNLTGVFNICRSAVEKISEKRENCQSRINFRNSGFFRLE